MKKYDSAGVPIVSQLGGAGGGGVAVSAAGASASAGTVVFSNSNNVSFGMAGSTVTATITVPSQTNQSVGFYGVGNTTQNSSTTLDARTVSFGGRGIVTVGYSNGTIQISATEVAQTNQTVGLYGLGNTTQNSSTTLDARTISFNGLGGMTVGYSNGSVQLSAPQTVAQTVQTQGIHSYGVSNIGNTAGNTGTVTGRIIFSGNNNITLSQDTGVNGSITIGISAANQTNQSVGFYGVGNTTQNSSTTLDARTVSFGGRGDISVGFSNGTIQISGSQSNQQISAFAQSNTTQSSSGTFNANSVQFAGAGIASVGVSNGSVVISVPAGGGAGDGVNIIAAGTRTATTVGTVLFSDANGVSWGLNAVNGSAITASVAAPVTMPGLQPYDDFVQVVGQVGQGSLIVDPQPMPNVSFDRFFIYLQNTNSSNSSGSHTLSFWVGLYTRNGSSLSSYLSTSGSTAVTHSGTAGSYSIYSGKRGLPITLAATSIPENRYWVAFVSRTTSGGANGTYSNYLVSNLNSNYTGLFGVAANATMQPRLGQGFYSATTSGIPQSIAFSEIQGTGSAAIRFPVIGLGSSTV